MLLNLKTHLQRLLVREGLSATKAGFYHHVLNFFVVSAVLVALFLGLTLCCPPFVKVLCGLVYHTLYTLTDLVLCFDQLSEWSHHIICNCRCNCSAREVIQMS